MVCSKIPNEAERNEQSIVVHCDTREVSRNRRSLSHKPPSEGREVNGASLLNTCGGARRHGKNEHSLCQKVEKDTEERQDFTQPKENACIELNDFEENGRCIPGLSCKAESDDRDAGTQEDPSRNEHCADVTVNTGTHGKPAYFIQVMVTFLLGWTVMAASTGVNFPGVLLPQFTDPDTDDLYLEPQSLPLFVSFGFMGTMVGSLLAGQLLAPLGVRLTILIGLLLSMVTWLGLFFSSQLWILLTCRVFQGCTYTLVKVSVVMYLVEVAHESLRGRLNGMLSIARDIGLFSSYILGGLMLTWRQLSLVYACILVPPAIGVFFLPNSPRWLTIHGHISEARKSLVFFRGQHYDVEAELMEVIRQVNEAGSSTSTLQQLRLLFRPGTVKMFLFLLILIMFYPLNGIYILGPYIAIILDVPGVPLNYSLSSLLCSIMKIVGDITIIITVDHLGRVPIIVVSFCFMSVCSSTYGYYIYSLDLDKPYSATWIPLATIIPFYFLSGISDSIVDLLQGELLPNTCRAASMPIFTFINGLIGFGELTSFYYMLEIIGMSGMFGFFTVVSIALALICLMVMPETRGLSLEEISNTVHSSKYTVMKKADSINQADVSSPDSA